MRYMKNCIVEFSRNCYKARYNETNLDMVYDKLSYPISFIVNKKRIAWFETAKLISRYKNLPFKKLC